jgi:hypothetical protein
LFFFSRKLLAEGEHVLFTVVILKGQYEVSYAA